MICEFSFSYAGELPDSTTENIAILQGIVRERLNSEHIEKYGFRHAHYTGDVRRVMAAFPKALIEIRSGDLPASTWEHIVEKLDQIIATSRSVGPADRSFNERVQVPVPGLGLLLINEVMVERDPCTDRLQEQLDEGWRILAVCPQPDQRRPDYILGRTKPSA